MNTLSRDRILGKLMSARRVTLAALPPRPVLSETALDRAGLLQRFSNELTSRTGSVYLAKDAKHALEILKDITATEGLTSIITAGVQMAGIDLKAFGKANRITITDASDLKDRETLREHSFTADAGLTFADFAVAETGTVGLIFNTRQPRLVSIAPPVHIAIIPENRLYPIYEDVIAQVFAQADRIPGQFAFITGPSATSDIQAVEFKGMHGPVKVIAIFVLDQT